MSWVLFGDFLSLNPLAFCKGKKEWDAVVNRSLALRQWNFVLILMRLINFNEKELFHILH